MLYVILVTLYFLSIPLGESPDEPGHIQCIQQVALYNRLPIVEPKPKGEWWKPGVTLSGRMCYHMPLYYLIAGLVQKTISYITSSPLTFDFPRHNEAFGETGVMFLHPGKQTLFDREETVALIGVRVVSTMLGLVMVWATVATAYLVFPKMPLAAVVAGVWVAGWPQFLFLSRAISNDVLANALAAVTFVLLLKTGKPQRYGALALLSALAVLSKVNMLFVVGTVAFVWLVEFVQYPIHRKALRKGALIGFVVWSATAAFIQMTPTIQTNFWSSALTFSKVNDRVFEATYWLDALYLTLSSGWVRFGWMNVAAANETVYIWWMIIVGSSIFGMVYWWRSNLPNRAIIAFVLFIWFAGNMAAYLRINLTVLQPQFRFVLSLLPIFGSFVAGGFLYILQHHVRYQYILVGLLIGISIIMNVAIIWTVVLPRYSLSI